MRRRERGMQRQSRRMGVRWMKREEDEREDENKAEKEKK